MREGVHSCICTHEFTLNVPASQDWSGPASEWLVPSYWAGFWVSSQDAYRKLYWKQRSQDLNWHWNVSAPSGILITVPQHPSLHVVLVCIFPPMSSEHLFMCFLASCVSLYHLEHVVILCALFSSRAILSRQCFR